jgi:hemerythrin superfamily protein
MKKIIQYYGLNNQKKKFAEENLELQEAITEYSRVLANFEGAPEEVIAENLSPFKQHIIEEIADNFVLLGEFMEYFGIKKYEVEGAALFKIGRTHALMEGESYNNDLLG